jgi:hypothetical protein
MPTRTLKCIGCLALVAGTASADPTSGVDTALFRSSYDSSGIFALEGARLAPKGDISFKVLAGFGRSPLKLAVPGIGAAAGDTSSDRVLDYVATFDLAFGMSFSDRIAFGLDVGGYRTSPGSGYGKRGLYSAGGTVIRKSTGLLALRPLSNLDPSANRDNASAFLGDELAGPLDARFGLKFALVRGPSIAITAVGSVFLPFGDDDMLLGDHGIVVEPKLALDWRPDRIHATRFVANVAARIRQRTVLQSFDVMDPTATATASTKAFLDVGSEAVVRCRTPWRSATAGSTMAPTARP